jgi:hypothetical protein
MKAFLTSACFINAGIQTMCGVVSGEPVYFIIALVSALLGVVAFSVTSGI